MTSLLAGKFGLAFIIPYVASYMLVSASKPNAVAQTLRV